MAPATIDAGKDAPNVDAETDRVEIVSGTEFSAYVSPSGAALQSVVLHNEQYKQGDRSEGAPEWLPESRTAPGPYEIVGPWDAMVGGQLNLPAHIDVHTMSWAAAPDATITRLIRKETAATVGEDRTRLTLTAAPTADRPVRKGDELRADGKKVAVVARVEGDTVVLAADAVADFPTRVAVYRVGTPLDQYAADPHFVLASQKDGVSTFVWPNPERDQSDVFIERTWQAAGRYRLAHTTRFVNLSADALTVDYSLDLVGWVDPWAEPPGMFSPPMSDWAPACHIDGSFEKEQFADLIEEDGSTLAWSGNNVRWLGIDSQYFLLAAIFPKEDGVPGTCTTNATGKGILRASYDGSEQFVTGRPTACLPDWYPRGRRSPDVLCSEAMAKLGVGFSELDETSLGRKLDLYAGDKAEAIQLKRMLEAFGASRREGRLAVTVFAGPKDLDELEATNAALTDSLDFWYFGFLAKPMLSGLKLFYTWFGNWMLAILLLTVLIKGLTLPLTHKSYTQMQKMQGVKPEMDELQKKYANDKERLQREMLNLYKRHNVNPLGGCLPMVFQMPVYIALYRCIYSAVDLYQAPLFGWITDMTQPDPYFVLPVFLGVFMFIQQMFMPQSPGADPAQQKMIRYVMPVMFSVFMLMLPSGLVFYIFVSTVLGITQQWLIKRKFEAKKNSDQSTRARGARSKA